MHYAKPYSFNISFRKWRSFRTDARFQRIYIKKKCFKQSKKILNKAEEKPNEVVRHSQWTLWMMERAGKKKSNVTNRQFWQQDSHPIEIWSLKVFEQKLAYIHYNPVESGFVTDPIDWK